LGEAPHASSRSAQLPSQFSKRNTPCARHPVSPMSVGLRKALHSNAPQIFPLAMTPCLGAPFTLIKVASGLAMAALHAGARPLLPEMLLDELMLTIPPVGMSVPFTPNCIDNSFVALPSTMTERDTL